MTEKMLLTTAGIITSSIVTFAVVQTPVPPMASTSSPAQMQVTPQPPQTAVVPPQTQVQTSTQTTMIPQGTTGNLPAPPPQNVVNQAFNSFAQQPQQQSNSGVAQPPESLPPLSSLVGNTPPTTSAVVNPFVVYGFICENHGTDCKALTSYGLVSKGQRISTYQYVADVTPYSVVVKDIIKIGKKIHREYHTYSLFQETGNQP